MTKLVFIIMLISTFIFAGNVDREAYPPQWDLMPVVYKDKIRPLDASARLWLEEVYHKDALTSEHRSLLNLKKGSAVEFLWKMQMVDEKNLEHLPLFWIGDEAMKTFLELDTASDRFSFKDLKRAFEDTLQTNLKIVEQLILEAFIKIAGQGTLVPGQKVLLRIINADIECKLLEKKLIVTSAPSIVPWHFLSALCFSSAYSIRLPSGMHKDSLASGLNSLMGHFLQYRDLLLSKTVLNTLFLSPFANEESLSGESISCLHAWIFSSAFFHLHPSKIASSLAEFFSDYDGVLKRKGNSYPTLWQLKAEKFLVGIRLWLPISILYSLGLVFCIWAMKSQGETALLKGLGWSGLGSAFALHSYILLLKTIVLAFLPISTLFDAGLCIAWLAVAFGLFLFIIFKRNGLLFSSVFSSVILFALLSIWNSQTTMFPIDFLFKRESWLLFHSAAKATGWGLLFSGGVIAHLSLIVNKKFSFTLQHCLYWGTLCLGISILTGELCTQMGGTKILEWGSQESLALLALCFYSALVHLGNYKKWENDAFAIGGCAGMIILGWGWKKGPALLNMDFEKAADFYPGFILLEAFFLAAILIRIRWFSRAPIYDLSMRSDLAGRKGGTLGG